MSESVQPSTKVAPLKLPPISEERLENGLSVITVEQHTLPLIAVRLVLRTGAIRDPKSKEGLASLTGQLLRRGTKTRTATQIDDTIEFVGGMLGADVSSESTSIAAVLPSEHADTALDIISDLARRPKLTTREFDLARRRHLAQLQQELDDPSAVTDRALVRFIYGADHPYGRALDGRLASVKRLKREDAVRFHKTTYGPADGMLVFAGDIDPQTAHALAKKHLEDWTGPALERTPVPMFTIPPGLNILLVDKPDATQAQVRITVPGVARPDPAYYATQLANVVVGGAFTSRLVDEVRVNRGLSYSVGTRVVAARDVGAITFSSFTKSETVRQLLDVTFGVLQEFHDKGPTEDELGRAKRLEIGLYPGRVESVEQLAGALAYARLLGMPFSTVSEYRDRMAAVTPAQAAAAAALFPTPAAAKVVVLGKASAIRPQLEGLGKITIAKVKDFE